jgi:hypothetical protein
VWFGSSSIAIKTVTALRSTMDRSPPGIDIPNIAVYMFNHRAFQLVPTFTEPLSNSFYERTSPMQVITASHVKKESFSTTLFTGPKLSIQRLLPESLEALISNFSNAS